jgi:hypothetical protein
MFRPAYLARELTSPLPTKDGGTLRTIGEAREYMAAIGEERELRLHWQHVSELMLEEADVAALTWRLQLAVLKDAKLDVTALSEPIERMMNKPPPGLLSDAKLNVMEEDQQPTELTESSERSDSDSNSNSNSKEECGPAEELQQAEARPVPEEEEQTESSGRSDSNSKEKCGPAEEPQQAEARPVPEEERRRDEELKQAEARRVAEEERRREEESQQAEARRVAEAERRREEDENRPFWHRFLWPYSRKMI